MRCLVLPEDRNPQSLPRMRAANHKVNGNDAAAGRLSPKSTAVHQLLSICRPFPRSLPRSNAPRP